MGLKSVLFSGILLSVMAVGVQAKPETGSGLDKSLLPQPVYSPEPGLVDLYWAAWDLAWGRVKHQDGIPQSPYMDENLWDDTIWIWDTEFMVLFVAMRLRYSLAYRVWITSIRRYWTESRSL